MFRQHEYSPYPGLRSVAEPAIAVISILYIACKNDKSECHFKAPSNFAILSLLELGETDWHRCGTACKKDL